MLGACLVGAVGIVAIALDGGEDGAVVGWLALAGGLGSAATFAVLVHPLEAASPRGVAAADGRLLGLPRRRARARAGAPPRRTRPAGRTRASGSPCSRSGSSSPGSSTLVYAVLLRHVTAQAAGVLTFLEPVAGVLLAWALLDERPGAATLVGGALVARRGIAVVLLEPAEARVADARQG